MKHLIFETGKSFVNTITYSVTDVGGNTVSVSRTVVVEDAVEEARTGTHYIGFSDFVTADVKFTEKQSEQQVCI